MADNENAVKTTEESPKSTPDQIKLWQERVSIARRQLEEWTRQSGTERIIQEHNGNFETFFNGLKGGKIPVTPINEIFAYVDADVSNTYNRDPYISVNPTAGTIRGAKLKEVRLNYYWRKLRVKNEVEPEIVDKDLAGFAWHKVGWEVETEGAKEELQIVKESLYSARVDWKDIVWNLGSKKPPEDCLWMAQRIVKPMNFVKRKYPSARKLQGTQNPEIDKNVYENAAYKDDIKVAVLWEIWDAEKRLIYLMAEGLNDKWLTDPRPWPAYMDEFPFLMYWDLYAPGKPRPMSAIASWEPQVHEKIVILAAALNHAKRWSRQLLIKKGALSNQDLDKFERGDDGAVIDYTGSGDLDRNSKMMDWGNIPVDYYQLLDRLTSIQRDVSGQPEFFRGGVTKTNTRTEGELQLIQEGAKGRMSRRIDRFETHLENIARHMMKHLDANFDFEETVKITGEEPQEVLEAIQEYFDPVTKTVTFTPGDIEGEYDVEIKAGSTLPLNKENKLTVAKDVLKILATVPPNSMSPLLRATISEIFDVVDMKVLKQAYAEEQALMERVSMQKQQEIDATEAKAQTQALKNEAQAQKVTAEAEIAAQEALMGPMGRAEAEKAKRPAPVSGPL